MGDWTDNFEKTSTQAVVTSLLKDQGWFVWVDEEIKTEADCSKTGSNNDGRRWIDGWCYDIFVWQSDGRDVTGRYDANSADSESDESFKALQEDAWGGASLTNI